MLYRRTAAALLTGLALLTAGCARVGPPELSVYADGDHINVEPLRYCDLLVRQCEPRSGVQGALTTLPGQPVQISVPSEIAETPWAISVQFETPDGTRPVIEEFFSPGERFAYTATPKRPGDRVLLIEVQQLGAAFAADEKGMPILDENGSPQLVVRGVWSVRFDAR